jgi:hypothetical protein
MKGGSFTKWRIRYLLVVIYDRLKMQPSRAGPSSDVDPFCHNFGYLFVSGQESFDNVHENPLCLSPIKFAVGAKPT